MCVYISYLPPLLVSIYDFTTNIVYAYALTYKVMNKDMHGTNLQICVIRFANVTTKKRMIVADY